MQEVIENFYNMYENEDLFCPASDEQIRKLSNLFGNNVNKIIDFYKKYQPNNIPMLDSYVQLLGIDKILLENTIAEPGKYLAEYGIYVFALTVGGNLLCIDTNDCKDDDASILIIDCNFCSYNDHYNCVEIGIVPDELMEDFLKNGIVILNYSNIKKCVKKIESSFEVFMNKLSNSEYDDIEEFLE